MEFGVLGTIEVVGGGRRFSLGGPKQRCVLALLVANAGGPVSVGSLIDGVYGENAPERAHRSIHTFVSNLRAELGDVIERRGDGYVLTVDRAEIDALRFEDLVAEAGAAEDPARAGELLRDALGLWRGHPYADVDANTVLGGEVTRLSEIRMAAIEARVDADLACGRDSELLGELDSLAAEYPLHERFRAQQMLALYRAGRQGEALRAYSRTRLYLVEEMGLDPSPELQQLEARILDQDPSLLLPSRPKVTHAAVVVADLGDARQLTLLPPAVRFKVLSEQAAVITNAVTSQGGRVFANSGAATYAWFGTAAAAAHAAAEMRRRAPAGSPQMRLAVAVGDLEVAADDVSGPPIRRAASLVASAHPGQILLAEDAQEEVAASGAAGLLVRSLGSHDIEGLAEHELVYQLGVDGSSEVFPPLLTGERPASLPYHERGLPGYELREGVRASAFGLVHRGYQPSLGREVAIKIIHSEYANDPSFIRRFEIEAQMVTRLEHPHIAPLLDYWRSPEGAFLVMRWMGGGTLADRIQESPLSVEQTDVILTAIGAALDYAHRNGIAHGNLNPASVVFDGEGNPYLTDFNVAHPLDTVGNLIGGDVHDLAQLVERCVEDDESVEAFLIEATSAPGYATVQDLLDGWRDVVGERTAATVATFTATRNPYKGLRAFSELDADDFFGRDHETARLVDTVRERRLVAVVGPSGVGKSSVVRAGLLPLLRAGVIDGSEEWLVVDMIPGPYPFEELASCLLRVAAEAPADLEAELRRDERGLVKAITRYLPRDAKLVLVIDQFEELFTLVADDAEREAFLQILRSAVLDERANVRVIVTMRADLFDRPLRFGGFGDLLSDATVPMPAATAEGLRQMIEMPAARVGVVFEPGLADRIAVDVKDQPGALPLLEFSLTELFETRTADVLTVADYERTGGVLGALGRRAESIYDGLGDEAEGAVRELFLRMVRVAEAGRDTRRRVRRSELAHLGIGSRVVDRVLKAFGDERLLTFDRDPITRGPTVEVAHEAILSEWERLAGWIGEYREDLLMRGRLGIAVGDWEASGRSEEFLLSGGRLNQHEVWTATTELALSSAEQDFLDASTAAADARRARRHRLRRVVVASFGVVAVVALALAVVAMRARSTALHQGDIARLRTLAAAARAQIDQDPERAVLLAAEAVRQGNEIGEPLRESVDALREALVKDRVVQRYGFSGYVTEYGEIDVDPAGSLMLVPALDRMLLVDVAGGDVVREFAGPAGMVATSGFFNGDGTRFAVYFETPSTHATAIWAWDVEDPTTPVYQVDGTFSYIAMGGDYLITKSCDVALETGPCDLQVRDASNGDVEYVIDDVEDGRVAIDPGGHRLVDVDNRTRTMTVYDLGTREAEATADLPAIPQSVSVSPAGDRVALVSGVYSHIWVIEVMSGKQIMDRAIDRPWVAAWSDDGSELIVAGNSGVVEVMAAATGVTRLLLRGNSGVTNSVAVLPGSDDVIGGPDANGELLRWDIGIGPVPTGRSIASGLEAVRQMLYVEGRDEVFAVSPDRGVVFDFDGDVVRELDDVREDYPFITSTMSGATSYYAWVDSDGTGVLADPTTGEIVYVAPAGYQVAYATPDLSTVLLATYSKANIPSKPRLVDVASGDVIGEYDLDFLSPGKFCLGSISRDAELVWFWDCASNGAFFTASGNELTNMRYRGSGAMFMPDGHTLVIIDLDYHLRVFDLDALRAGADQEEALIKDIEAHDGFATSWSVNADGTLLATAARSDPIRVWDTTTWQLIAEIPDTLLPAPLASPHVALHPTEPRLLVASAAGEILEYTLDTDEVLRAAEDRVTRSLTDAECRTFLNLETCPRGR